MLSTNLCRTLFSVRQLAYHSEFEFSAVNSSAHLISPLVSLETSIPYL